MKNQVSKRRRANMRAKRNLRAEVAVSSRLNYLLLEFTDCKADQLPNAKTKARALENHLLTQIETIADLHTKNEGRILSPVDVPHPRVVAAAIIGYDGKAYHVPAPGRHHDVIQLMVKLGHPTPIKGLQGFMLSDGRFVRRSKARVIAEERGQLLPRHSNLKELYSEDVW